MRVGLTGTPGTGKSTVAIILQKEGFTVVRLNELAIQNRCIDGTDKTRKSKLIDVRKLNRYIAKNYAGNDLVFFEGHVAHLLRSMQKIIILRCHPSQLTIRLRQKQWNTKKIRENVEAEILDVILCEAVERHLEKNIFEIDTTYQSIKQVAASILEITNKKFRPTKPYSIGQIDWSEEILKEYSG
jgi:adenylate kinase